MSSQKFLGAYAPHKESSTRAEEQGTKLSVTSYLCALPSPFCRSSMISGTVWAGSLGLSKYNRTFLPYLSFTMLGKELMISYVIKKQKTPLQRYLHSKFSWDLVGTNNTPLATSLRALTSKCEVHSDMSYQNIVNYLLWLSLVNNLFVLTDQTQGL